MSHYPQQLPYQRRNPPPFAGSFANADSGVFAFFNTVYAWMCVGLALTGAVGWYVANTPALMNFVYQSPGVYLFIGLVAFAIAMYAQSQIGRLRSGTATVLFLLYATIVGALISGIFLLYPVSTLGAAFVLTGGTFGVMSLYGFVTRRDLTSIGSICVMLAFGFVIASFVNFFVASDAFSWVITYAILVLFVVITAYQTQRLKYMAEQTRGQPELAKRVAIIGSLVLYICFINLFLSILRILGDRR